MGDESRLAVAVATSQRWKRSLGQVHGYTADPVPVRPWRFRELFLSQRRPRGTYVQRASTINRNRMPLAPMMMRSVKSMTSCGDCHFYTSRDGYRGDCRRSSPVVSHWGGTRWPVVPAGTRACGEFKLRRHAETITNDQIDCDAFSPRVYNALRRGSIESWRQLQQLETGDLLTIQGIGTAGVEEIVQVRNARQLKSPTRGDTRASVKTP